jgi:hypothetical protein
MEEIQGRRVIIVHRVTNPQEESMHIIQCPDCFHEYTAPGKERCPSCGKRNGAVESFKNSDELLRSRIPALLEERKKAGLEGLVGGLACLIINTEKEHLKSAAVELLGCTGLHLSEAFEDPHYQTIVLRNEESADFILRSRKGGDNPFAQFNSHPRSAHLPNTRVEAFVFNTHDIQRYSAIQRTRGIKFLTPDPVDCGGYLYIQTEPSSLTGNSLGFIEWRGKRGTYGGDDCLPMEWKPVIPGFPFLSNIKKLDHAATRVHARDRDDAILEFMEFTSYTFDFAIYVESLNSITNVARLLPTDFALVFTSGISDYVDDDTSGPTEKFIHNYGTRVHHLAFHTEKIEETYKALDEQGMNFLIELVGSPEEGLKQTFSASSPFTLLVNEYIHRYGDFDGFFTKSNVSALTEATGKQ